ncbi:alpha/beta fold hydrolase [Streptomyces indicus]|uniref:Pimeloyl-ACP methyl ester carboxylesterase n=1 Tax=Streptomyces indicus TaxID=417292 RepID=A0A1G8T999_9ACTN|nr:alpha/beta fold hydrolase [Streptomyces indicus]SDJ38229.1 Pimeloyl-ACP methyl ester carboxylesterase [Streptomyces indicus]
MSATSYAVEALHLEEAGDKDAPVALCLHGIGSSSAAFASQMDALAAEFHVLAWDAPGYAKSADPQGPLTMDDYADLAAEIIRPYGGAHVLGVSWGGVIALRLAARHPELVDSVMVVDSTPGSGTSPEKAAGMRARVAELERLGPQEFAAARGPRLVSAQAPAELAERVTATMAASVRMPGYGYAAESMATTDLRRELQHITAPALVLCGAEDRITGPDASQVLAGGLHKTAYVIVKDAGHLANQEQPAHVNDWLLSHLDIVAQLRADRLKG